MKTETQIRKLRDLAKEAMSDMNASFDSLIAANLLEGALSWVLDESSRSNEILDKIAEQWDQQKDLTE